jgi:serralysin
MPRFGNPTTLLGLSVLGLSVLGLSVRPCRYGSIGSKPPISRLGLARNNLLRLRTEGAETRLGGGAMSENLDRFCMCVVPKKSLGGTKAAILNDYRWPVGANVTVRFLGGNQRLQDRVRAVASEWVAPGMAKLYLDFRPMTEVNTNIRIAFQPGKGSWSFIGSYCRDIPEPNPTMNFGWIDANSPDQTLRSVVLHEFGHALGLIHEHQNPGHAIRWNEAAVNADLGGPPNNWDRATIQHNMFDKYSPDAVTGTDVDPKSIMMYPIPKSWTLDGFSAGFNAELSDKDKTFIRFAYPA